MKNINFRVTFMWFFYQNIDYVLFFFFLANHSLAFIFSITISTVFVFFSIKISNIYFFFYQNSTFLVFYHHIDFLSTVLSKYQLSYLTTYTFTYHSFTFIWFSINIISAIRFILAKYSSAFVLSIKISTIQCLFLLK